MNTSTPSTARKHRARKPRLTARQRRILDAGTPDIRNALDALARYDRRQGRIGSKEYPDGQRDKGGRWYPSAAEDADDIIGYFRRPSAAFPMSYFKACFSLSHCEALENADHELVLDVRREAKAAGFGDTFDAETKAAVLAHIDSLFSAAVPPAVSPTRARARL
ncbi:hypothetical protein KPL74_01735 [Bacillus sp. NP157]|nr:hypothetical protein KPL74_01735 [Bacillus sp. NP157]